jgi:diguanylate cyclase (GGDEF)-like protein/PAS domain S-box-containing protein
MLISASPAELQDLTDVIAASVAIVENNSDHGYMLVAYNKRFAQMLGINAANGGLGVTLNSCIPRYVYSNFEQQLTQVFDRGEPQDFEQPLDSSSITRWWRISLKPMIEPSGITQRVLITGIDISDSVALEMDLDISNSRFSSVIDAAYDGIITMDQNQRINLFNAAAEGIFGYTQNEVLGEPITMLMAEIVGDKHLDYINQFKRSPMKTREMMERSVIYGLRKNGTEFPAEITISKIDVIGEMEYTAIVRDVSERTRLLDELERSATTDPLTGLKNRACLTDKMDELITVNKRYGHTFSIILIDLDHFKQINDSHGHDVGDEVLKRFAQRVLPLFREVDLLARYGGEEFVGLLPDTQLEGAAELAERLRKTIEDRKIDANDQGDVKFTVSIGVAQFGVNDDARTIFKRSDGALYRAKEAGRNRVECDSL